MQRSETKFQRTWRLQRVLLLGAAPRTFVVTLVLGLGAAGLADIPAARAQDADAIAEARGKFQRALELEQGRNYGGALKLFREVGMVKMTPQVRYHIATCEEQLGQLVAALGGYELALSTAEGMHPDFIHEVETSIEKLKARIPKLVLQRGDGAEAASIELDGVALGASSIGEEIPLNPGPHTVRATAPGFDDYQQTITVAEGGVESLSIEMVAQSSAPADAVASDRPLAEEEKQKSFGALPYVLGGGGLVIAAVGGTFIGLSQSKAGKVKELCGGTDCTALSGEDRNQAQKWSKSAHTMEGVGWAAVGVGAAALATGTVLFFVDRGRQENSQQSAWLRIVPAAPASDVGWSLQGQF